MSRSDFGDVWSMTNLSPFAILVATFFSFLVNQTVQKRDAKCTHVGFCRLPRWNNLMSNDLQVWRLAIRPCHFFLLFQKVANKYLYTEQHFDIKINKWWVIRTSITKIAEHVGGLGYRRYCTYIYILSVWYIHDALFSMYNIIYYL